MTRVEDTKIMTWQEYTVERTKWFVSGVFIGIIVGAWAVTLL